VDPSTGRVKDGAYCGSADNGEPTLLTTVKRPSGLAVALDDGEFDMKAKLISA
jgi:hypothetical protein